MCLTHVYQKMTCLRAVALVNLFASDPILMKSPDIVKRLSRLKVVETGRAMNLMAREGGVRDIPRWHELHRTKGLPYPAKCSRILPQMWHTLLAARRLLLFLVEDRSLPLASRIVSCCAALFVTDAFCEEMKRKSPPFFSVELARLYLEGELPVLSRAEIAEANAGQGLNLMICFDGRKEEALSGQEALAIREKQSAALQLVLSGYQIKEMLANPIGDEAYQEMIDGGARLRRDCLAHPGNRSKANGKNLRSRIVGLTKEEAEAHRGSHLSGLFVYSQPRFHFSRAEQRLLRHALIGETREDLAASLSLSAWTVKQRWESIYGRVAAVDRELLPSPIAYGPEAHSRGFERRRRLLNYLRQHPEELRPAARRSPRFDSLSLALFCTSLLTSGWSCDF